ncbi:MAG: flippase-like domain-containing protein [Desulfovibrionaceae bacterium]|nr:flippase-like domain-containing protein [Desulfovibrionaceae bacterium]MBF0515420.1 flippase-like domain-containing protein [Desulfovibrionaceae bacterium]
MLKLALVAGCLYFVVRDVDFREFWRVVMRFDPTAIAVVTLYSLLGYVMAGLRLNYLTRFDAGNRVCFDAYMLSMGVNNIAPAKLGEVSKALFLRTKCNYSLAKTLSIVFWERFFDLNALLLMGCVVALIFRIQLAFVPLAVCVLSIWGALFVIKYFPATAQWIVDKVPVERLRLGLSQVREQLVHGVNLPFFLTLGLYTAGCWLLYAGNTILVVTWIAHVPLSLDKVLAVFVLSSVGMAMPSSPGALGVFEFAVVFSMSTIFKVDNETALAVGLLLHMMLFVPTTLYGMWVFLKSGMTLKKIHDIEEQGGQ